MPFSREERETVVSREVVAVDSAGDGDDVYAGVVGGGRVREFFEMMDSFLRNDDDDVEQLV